MNIIRKNKKALILGCVMAMSLAVTAKPPLPPATAEMQADTEHEHSIYGNPVGTATLLMLGLGAGVLGYTVKRNCKKEKNSEK